MKPSDALQANRAAIRRIVELRRAKNPRVFGSVLHGEDSEGSNLDLLVDPTPETSLFDLNAISNALEKLLGVPVDLVTSRSIGADHEIARTATPL